MAVAAILTVCAVVNSESFQSCVEQPQYPSPYKPLNESAPQLRVTWSRLQPCVGVFLKENGEAITAIFTIILGISTIGLWLQTKRIAEDTRALFFSERRPWINAALEADSELRFSIDEADVTLRFVATNSGESPATFVMGRAVAVPQGIKLNEALGNFVKENRTLNLSEMGVTVFPNKDEELLRYNLRIKRADFDLLPFGDIGYAPSLMCAAIYKTPLDEGVHQTAFLAELRTKGMLHMRGDPVPKDQLTIRVRGLWSYTD
jgi:hypothetical protein